MSKNKKKFLIILFLVSSIAIIITAILYFRSFKNYDLVDLSKKYNVIFEGYTKENKKEVYKNDLVTKPKDKDMEKANNLFIGWKIKNKEEFYNFETPVTSDLILSPVYYSLDIIKKVEEKLTDVEKEKYTKESINNLEKVNNETKEKLNDKNIKNKDKVLYLINLEKALENLELKNNTNPINPIKEEVEVTFVFNNGIENKVIKINKDTKLEKPTNPEKQGFVFKGWYKDQEFNQVYDFEQVVNNNLTLYAKWENKPISSQKVTVTLNLDGGLLDPSNYEIEKGTKFTKPQNPVKQNYKFIGWFVSQEDNSKIFDFETLIQENTTIFAKWELVKHTVIAIVGENELTEKVQKVQHGKKAIQFSNPIRKGYNFINWYKDEELTQLFDFNIEIITSDINLYPKFEKQEFTISLNLNDGQIVGENTIKVLYEEKATKPTNPTKDGHKFLGWYKENTFENEFIFENELITSNIEVFAKWELNQYSIIFDLNGGNINGSVKNITKIVNHNEFVEKPLEPTKQGLIFFGWVLNELDPHKFDFENTKITSNLVLKAYFESEGFSVTFVLADGETLDVSSRVKVKENQNVIKPQNDPVKENHIFDKWYKEQTFENEFDFDQVITMDTEIYPKFIRTHAYIYFNLNGGEVQGQDLKIKQAVNTQAKEPTTPTNEGHTFIGWFKEDGITKFDFTTENITQDITLTAKWELNKYKVVFDVDGFEIDEEEINHGSFAIKPGVEPIKQGYTFKGWYVSNEEDAEKFDFDSTYIYKNIRLYAKFEINKYTVSFNVGTDVTPIENQTINYNEKASEPKAPEKEGYTFKGWFKENTYTNKFDFNLENIIADIELFAKFDINLYTITFSVDGNTTKILAQEVEYNQQANLPNEQPTKEGHTFVKWVTQENGDTEYDFNTNVTSNITLYAKFEINKYTVSFNVGAGVEAIENQTINYNEKATRPTKEPKKEGHTFKGWYKEEAGINEFVFENENITSNTEVFAVFTINIYNVVFKANGTDYETKQVQHGNTVQTPTIAPQKEGYTFKAWVTEENGDEQFDLLSKITSNLELFAKFEINQYKVNYTIEDGEYEDNQETSIKVNHGDIIQVQPLVKERDLYSVKTWVYTSDTITNETEFIFGTTKVVENITIKPVWEQVHAYVNLDVLDGNYAGPKKIKVQINKPFTKPVEEPTKENYTFKGWFKETTFNTEYDFSQNVVDSITLYAKFELNKYTVEFNVGNAGVQVDSQEVEHGQKAKRPDDPQKEGLIFINWFTEENGNEIFDFETLITKNTVIYAKFEIKKFNVVFVTGENASSVPTQKVVYNQKATEPEEPTKEGYSFLGWFVSELDNSEKFNFENTLIAEDTTIYAKWELKKYTITFNIDGNTATEKSQEVNHGSLVDEPVAPPTKANHKFIGWVLDLSSLDIYEFNTPVKSAFTLYAKFELNKYTVSFNSNGGSQVDSQTIIHGQMAQQPTTNPTKKGYNFLGWFVSNQADTTKFEFSSTQITQDIEIFAKWEIKVHTLTFDVDGDTTKIPAQKITHGEYPDEVEEPKKDGHTFVGWTLVKDGDETFDYVVEAIEDDITLYAKFTPKKYFVSFDVDGDRDTIPQQEVPYGEKATKPEPDPEKPGYNFIGWFPTKESDRPIDFTNKSIFDSLVVYAKFEKKTYTITFNPNGGELAERQANTASVKYDETHSQQPELKERAGFILSHWSYEEESVEKKFEFGTTKVKDNLTLKAIWLNENMTVTYILDKNNPSSNVVKTVSRKNTNPKAVDLEDSQKNKGKEETTRFKKWVLSSQEDTADAYNFDTRLENDLELRAVYYELMSLDKIKDLEEDELMLVEGRYSFDFDDSFILEQKNDEDTHSKNAILVVGSYSGFQKGQKVRALLKVAKAGSNKVLMFEASSLIKIYDETVEEYSHKDLEVSDLENQDFINVVVNIQKALFVQKMSEKASLFTFNGKNIIIGTNQNFDNNSYYKFEKVLVFTKQDDTTIIYTLNEDTKITKVN